MDATTAQPTLLSAARNFIRKSAGKAVLTIAPLAAISVTPEVKAQTIFSAPTVQAELNGTANMSSSGFLGSDFSVQGATNNNITGIRVGATGLFTTNYVNSSGAGDLASNNLIIFQAITNFGIPAAVLIPIDYDFTLAKQTGIAGNVTWLLHAEITNDDSYLIGSGTLTTPSATFTGSGSYTVLNNVPGDLSQDLKVYLTLSYTTANGDELAVTMLPGSQGFTVNAIPEPSTYAMLIGLGALGFVIVHRSRRNRA